MKYWIALLATFPLAAEIREITTFEQIDRWLNPTDFLVFDIDNTLMETAQMLGSDQWFSYRIQQYLASGYSPQEATEIALAQWVAVQSLTQVKLVETSIPSWMTHWQSRGHSVMALTLRGLGLAHRTDEQLLSLQIDFRNAAPSTEPALYNLQQTVLYRDGMLFTAGTNKGIAFAAFLADTGLQPPRVVMIDDKRHHLETVEHACEQLNLPFLGLRYSYADTSVRAFSPEIADIQWEAFGHLISDDEARHQLQDM